MASVPAHLLVLRVNRLAIHPHNSPVQYSGRHTGQDSAEVIKPHLSAGSVHRLHIYPVSMLSGRTSMIITALLNPQWLTAQAQDLITIWCYFLMNLCLIMLFVSCLT